MPLQLLNLHAIIKRQPGNLLEGADIHWKITFFFFLLKRVCHHADTFSAESLKFNLARWSQKAVKMTVTTQIA